MIETADEVLDLGPGGGERGGELLFQGSVEDLLTARRSLTAQYLSGKLVPGESDGVVTSAKSSGKKEFLTILGAAQHNLKKIDVQLPLRQFVVITGVSGSGKSTLVYDVLYKNFLRERGLSVQDPGQVEKIRGLEHIDQIVLVDQSPIGRSPRSNPATYMGA